jgi:hypothetical protein
MLVAASIILVLISKMATASVRTALT